MSRTTIDQLFQITTPTSAGRDSSRLDQGGGELFRSHLKRAADLSDAKQPTIKDRQPSTRLESAALDEDAPLEAQTEQRETTSAQQEEPQVTTESVEATEETDSNEETGDETGDEVTLSAAAAATPATVDPSEIATATEQASGTAGAAEAVTSGHNNTLIAATPGAASATAAASEADSETGLPGTETAKAAIEGDAALASDGEGEQDSQQRQTPQTTRASGAHTTDDAKQEVVQAKSTTGQPEIAQSLATKNTDVDPEPEAAERFPERGESPAQQPSPAQAFLAPSAATDAELTLTSAQLNAPEAHATPTSSPSGETVVIGERTITGGLTSKASHRTDATSGRESTETPTIDRARFVQRVGGAIRTAQQRDGQIQLRLSPPELGTLKIQISMTEGAVTARLETETVAARTLLLDNLPALRERLAEQDIRIEKFDVDVGRDDQQPTDHPSADERQPRNSRPQKANSISTVKSQEAATADASASANSVASTSSGLDVRI